MTYDELVATYAGSGHAAGVVHRWYQETAPSDQALVGLAEVAAKQFVDGEIDFRTASGLLNQLMPLIGFESAPRRFWEFYTALEDFETLDDPEQAARPAIARLLYGVAG
jgi:hypothetical protein